MIRIINTVVKGFLGGMILVGITIIIPGETSAQVVINEFSSADSNDWIEFYNTSPNEIDLTGWVIRDTASSAIYEFSGSKIPAGGFCYKEASNRLNNGGDRIQLFNGADIADCVSYGNGNASFCGSAADVAAPSAGESASRVPDGAATWSLGAPTQTPISCESLIPSPTPTLTPTPEPTSSSTPTPNPTSTPTLTPTPKATATPTKTPTKAPTAAVSANSSKIEGSQPGSSDSSPNPAFGVLGLRDELKQIKESTEEAKTEKTFPVLAIALVGIGILLIGVSGFVFFRARRKTYNESDDETP